MMAQHTRSTREHGGQTPVEEGLPYPTTTFVGREAEVQQLRALLELPHVRLITICAPGGMGKTRLALEVLQRTIAGGGDACFVALQPIRDVADIPKAIAEALGVPLTGANDPFEQILAVLRSCRLVLACDNAEHLADVAPYFSRLVRHAPQLKLLVTTREALQLQEEWLVPLDGLPAAVTDGEHTPAAVQLFFDRARQVYPAFDPVAEYAAVGEICRLLGGMPLAIELAAGWVRTLTCAAIAEEIQRGQDLPLTGLRNLPERHRSLRLICDQAWQQLGARRQQIFARLCLFRAGFSRRAAAAVAEADLPDLDDLTARAIVRRGEHGRYQIHELLRQYGADRLHEHAAEVAEAHAAQGRYYAEQLQAWSAICGYRGIITEVLSELEPEIENIRAAWPDIMAARGGEQLRSIANMIQNFFFVRGPYRDGVALVSDALTQLQQRPPTPERLVAIGDCYSSLGWFQLRAGHVAEAEAMFSAGRAATDALPWPRPRGDVTEPLIGLGVTALVAGEYQQAIRLGMAAIARAEAEQHPGNHATGLYVLVSASLAQGHAQIARRYAEQMTQITEATGNRWFLAYCRVEQGNIAAAVGDQAAARRHYQAAFELRREFRDPQGMAIALVSEGHSALAQGLPHEADQLYARSLAIYRTLGDRGGLADALDGSGRAQLALGDRAAAQAALIEALQVAIDMAFVSRQLAVLLSSAELLAGSHAAHASMLIALVQQHPAASGMLLQRAAQLGITAYAGAIAAEQLPTLAATTLHYLGTLDQSDGTNSGSEAVARLLGPREHEILVALVAGQTNPEISKKRFCSGGTIKWYTTRIYIKLGVGNRTQAVARARELGLLP